MFTRKGMFYRIIIKRPVITDGELVTVGWNDEVLEKWKQKA